MSTGRQLKPIHRLSRYEWCVCVALAALVVTGVTLEISRLTAKARKVVPAAETVNADLAAGEAPGVPTAENLSTR